MTTPVVLQGSTAPVVLQHAPTPVVIKKDDGTALVVQTKETTVVVAVAEQGPPGPPGEDGAPGSGGGASNVMEYVADGALGGHRIVRATAAGKVGYVDPSDPDQAHATLGLTTGAVADGALASVQFAGPITEPSWSWTPNLPVFVGAAGVPTQTPPSSGFHAPVGVAVSATSMVIQLKSPIVL